MYNKCTLVLPELRLLNRREFMFLSINVNIYQKYLFKGYCFRLFLYFRHEFNSVWLVLVLFSDVVLVELGLFMKLL